MKDDLHIANTEKLSNLKSLTVWFDDPFERFVTFLSVVVFDILTYDTWC